MARQNFLQAARRIGEAFMFEMFLRFYFAKEKDGKVFLDIPAKDLDKIKENHTKLAAMAEMLNHDELDYRKSLTTVCAFVAAHFDGAVYGQDFVARALDSKEFKVENYLFNLWLKGHEEFLDAQEPDFAQWRDSYLGWLETEEVREYVKRLDEDADRASGPCSETLH